MARIPFQKPKTIQWEILTDRYGRLVAEPFEKGYALTVGNSLRRTLLSIVPGAAVAWVRIAGVQGRGDPDSRRAGGHHRRAAEPEEAGGQRAVRRAHRDPARGQGPRAGDRAPTSPRRAASRC